jgi:excisionase family DNA binding protein
MAAPLKPRPSRLLTVTQVATRLGLKERTIRRWVQMRRITYVKLGHAVRIPERSLHELVRRRTVQKIE